MSLLMIPQFSHRNANKIALRNQPSLISAIQNANLFEKGEEIYIINEKELVVEVYKSNVGVEKNSVFEKEKGPIFYLKRESEFTDDEYTFLMNMFEKIRGKNKIIT